jgi:hypothetical protein
LIITGLVDKLISGLLKKHLFNFFAYMPLTLKVEKAMQRKLKEIQRELLLYHILATNKANCERHPSE